ncbi:MAG: hypothetical protein HRT94_00155 [Alphaproteobacteria bacterium]|nr:hypothetical protein [Alphaproteobacteria bacterium]
MKKSHPFGVIDGGRPDDAPTQKDGLTRASFAIASETNGRHPAARPEAIEDQRRLYNLLNTPAPERMMIDLPIPERETSDTVSVIKRQFMHTLERLMQHISSQGQSSCASNGEWLLYIYQGNNGFAGRRLNGNAVDHQIWINRGKDDRLMAVLDPLLDFDAQWPQRLMDLENPESLVEAPLISKNIQKWIDETSTPLQRRSKTLFPSV